MVFLDIIKLCCLASGVAAAWDGEFCKDKTAKQLTWQSPEILQTVTPECLANLKYVHLVNLASVLPHLREDIFSQYNRRLQKNTVRAMSIAQFAHYGASIEGPICRELSPEHFENSVLDNISMRCLEGMLTARLAPVNLKHLHNKVPTVLLAALRMPAVCERLDIVDLAPLSPRILSSISSRCFAQLRDVTSPKLSSLLPHLQGDIFAEFDGYLHPEVAQALTAEHLWNYGMNLEKDRLCELLDLSQLRPEVVPYIPKRCLLGLLSGPRRGLHDSLWGFLSRESFEYLMTNPQGLCLYYSAKGLLNAPSDYDGLWKSWCVSLVAGLVQVKFGARLQRLPDRIFEYYRGGLCTDDLTIMPPEKMAHYGERVDPNGRICSQIDLTALNDEALVRVPVRCLRDYLASHRKLDKRHWDHLVSAGAITKAAYYFLVEAVALTDELTFPMWLYWENWYREKVQGTLLNLFREYDPPRFVKSIYGHRLAFIWLFCALRNRQMPDYGMIQQVIDLVDNYPEQARHDIIERLSSLWRRDGVMARVRVIFARDAKEAFDFARHQYPAEQPGPTIPLIMDKATLEFDFDESYNFSVTHGHQILHERARLQSSTYIDQGGPMRQWVEQMLNRILERGLLEIDDDGRARFPFFADRSVGRVVGLVYFKAIQLNITPSPLLFPSIQAPSRKEFESLYQKEFRNYARTILRNVPTQRPTQDLYMYDFVEPEDMKPWHPIRTPQMVILPEVLDEGEFPSKKMYTIQTFSTDFLPRFRQRCWNEFILLSRCFMEVATRVVVWSGYLCMLRRSLFDGLFKKTLFSPRAILETIGFEGSIADQQIMSLVGAEKTMTMKEALETIIHSFGDRELARFVATATGSERILLNSYQLTITRRHLNIGVLPAFAFGDGRFISTRDHDEIVGRMFKLHRDMFGMGEGKFELNQAKGEFYAGYVCTCASTIELAVQSSYGLLLSIFHLLNENPAQMEDANVCQ